MVQSQKKLYYVNHRQCFYLTKWFLKKITNHGQITNHCPSRISNIFQQFFRSVAMTLFVVLEDSRAVFAWWIHTSSSPATEFLATAGAIFPQNSSQEWRSRRAPAPVFVATRSHELTEDHEDQSKAEQLVEKSHFSLRSSRIRRQSWAPLYKL